MIVSQLSETLLMGVVGCFDSDGDGWADLDDDFPEIQVNGLILI